VTADEIAFFALKKLEGCRLAAYQDQGGVWTIGYGHTGPEVRAGLIWTQAQADARLILDLTRFSRGVRGLVQIGIGAHRMAALFVFAFNVGLGAFSGSTLLKAVNAGRWDEVPRELLRWNKIGGIPNRGLLARRQAEIDIWNSPDSLEAA
jgi:lysozyme